REHHPADFYTSPTIFHNPYLILYNYFDPVSKLIHCFMYFFKKTFALNSEVDVSSIFLFLTLTKLRAFSTSGGKRKRKLLRQSCYYIWGWESRHDTT
ncbi:hypothetical protein ACJX0J_013014, partial [Zea mays]